MYKVERYSLSSIVELSAKHYGDRPALSMIGGKTFSYSDVETLSRRYGLLLQHYGLKRGDKVLLLAENSPYWGIAYFAIVQSGGIVVPILTDFTASQVKNILNHSEAKFVLCSEKYRSRVEVPDSSVVLLDIRTGRPLESNGLQTNPGLQASVGNGKTGSPGLDTLDASEFIPVQPSPDDVATIIYTSGTTGQPKGVMLSHRNILSNAIATRSIIVLRRSDRLLSILPLAHTYEFTIGFIIPFLAGSHIYYLDKPPTATALLPALSFVKPTIMLSVPLVIEKIYLASIRPSLESIKAYQNPIFRPLLIRVAGSKLKKTFGGKLRFFGIGGAALAPECEAFLKKAGFPYAIGYGLTETSPLLAGSSPKKTKLRSTGKALKGVSLRINSPNPISGEGELEARGENVFIGYYKDPDRTKEAFTEDGWFKTGDLGYMDSKGRLYIRGRCKTMILGASGENIYPEEIEALLNESPYIEESLVLEEDGALTAMVYLKSEILSDLESKVRDRIEFAEMRSSEAVHALLESIRKETNEKLAGFSKIRTLRLHREPFEKTPTQKIKRFLYGKQDSRNATNDHS
ncbi:MAG TPA: AMP-binding protein [Spirochaetales bacterium]|nr:AMP-binding protein [Spirochaetales bacterium]